MVEDLVKIKNNLILEYILGSKHSDKTLNYLIATINLRKILLFFCLVLFYPYGNRESYYVNFPGLCSNSLLFSVTIKAQTVSQDLINLILRTYYTSPLLGFYSALHDSLHLYPIN